MTVYLVGAGPGDPGLITARGLDLIRTCDVLVHDRLVCDELIEEAPADAIRIGREHLDQGEISRLLVLYGRRGLDVVRLKGGDPFVFGRGGEEALALAEAGIPFEVVPGVSSLTAVPAAAGIPVTHRGVSSHVTIANGQGSARLRRSRPGRRHARPVHGAGAAGRRSQTVWSSMAWTQTRPQR